ncbi:MmgE/PrpD family protein [Alcaligenaceae bacterium]|nr:MmgE/PrpD family protein [Alcaligenaceae bacterium]
MSSISLSRQFARWAAQLRYEDLPDEVIDKIKALLLHGLAGAFLGTGIESARHMVRMTMDEEGRVKGGSVFGRNEKASRSASAFANAELIHSSNLFDSYRMLTHPGPVLLPAALANAELENRSGKDIIVALACGYEFSCRLCDRFIPSTAARGFRPSPIYTIMGGALAGAKLLGLDEDGLVSAIAIAANFASGLNEGPRVGGNEMAIHEPHAARNAIFAGLVARTGHIRGAEHSLEGKAGFYNAFTGNNEGRLSYVFNGPDQVDPSSITEGLGQDYKLLNVIFRMYPCAGYNQPVMELLKEMVQTHQINAPEVERVAITMNWIETLYPSPAFPRFHDWHVARVGETPYYAAHVVVNGGYPVAGGRAFAPADGKRLEDDQAVIQFMGRHVKLLPSEQYPMFSPTIDIRMKDGREYSQHYPYARMEWDFEQLSGRLHESLSAPDLAPLIQVARDLDQLDSMEPVFSSIPSWESSHG